MIKCAQFVVTLAVPILAGCERIGYSAATSSKEAPPKVAHSVHEGELNTIVLTETAEQRIGLQTAAVESRSIHRRRNYGGEVALPTGRLDRRLLAGDGYSQEPFGRRDPAGRIRRCSHGDPFFLLVPLLSPERDVLTPAERVAYAQAKMQLSQAQVDAAGQVKQAQVQVDAAKIALDRAERLLQEMAGTNENGRRCQGTARIGAENAGCGPATAEPGRPDQT